MKTFRDSSDPWKTGLGSGSRLGRPVLVMGVLLLVVALAAGCTVVDELSTDTTATSSTETSSTLAVVIADTSTSLAATTTTLPPETTTTSTEASSTTITSTSTTAPPTTEPAVTPTTEATVGTQKPEGQQSEGTVLYEIADWSAGISGWAAAGQWKTAGGMLVTDGTSNSFAVAPVDLTGYPDYVVECEAQIIDPADETVLLLMARMINGTAYYGGFDGSKSRMVVGYDTSELGSAGFVLDSAWHTYRLEVRGNTVRLFLEQAEVARTMDNRALEPGTVGIYCGSGQINVRSFKVTAL